MSTYRISYKKREKIMDVLNFDELIFSYKNYKVKLHITNSRYGRSSYVGSGNQIIPINIVVNNKSLLDLKDDDIEIYDGQFYIFYKREG